MGVDKSVRGPREARSLGSAVGPFVIPAPVWNQISATPLAPATLQGTPRPPSHTHTSSRPPHRLLLAGVAGCVQFSRVPDISAAVLALLRAWGPATLEWLRQALALLPDTSASVADKQAMMSEWSRHDE